MPRLKGLGMPSKRKRATAKLQEVPEPDADEVDQERSSTAWGRRVVASVDLNDDDFPA